MRLSIDIRVEHPKWDAVDLDAIAEAAGEATLSRLGIDGPAEAALLATSDAAIAELNASFRDKPSATNVLSWPVQDLAPPAQGLTPAAPHPDGFGDLVLGDIALAYETCAQEAAAAEKPLSDHTTHLVVHALLHLLGYDHTSDADARLMEGLETEILSELGISDPYVIDG